MHTLEARRKNPSLSARWALMTLLAANKRLITTAYPLRESFAQLWDHAGEGWARRFFEHWRAACPAVEVPSAFRTHSRSRWPVAF